MAAATSPVRLGHRSAYVSNVSAADAWPMTACKVFTSALALIARLAYVCRSECIVSPSISSMPAARRAGNQTRLRQFFVVCMPHAARGRGTRPTRARQPVA